jgi:predicted nucleotidyltransferase
MPELLTEYRAILRRELPRLTQAYGVTGLALFGSRVRGQGRKDSDLDVLADFLTTPSLLRWIALENELTDLLGVKVDLVLRQSLKPEVGQRISGDLVPV